MTDRQTDGRTDRLTDRQTDGQTDGRKTVINITVGNTIASLTRIIILTMLRTVAAGIRVERSRFCPTENPAPICSVLPDIS